MVFDIIIGAVLLISAIIAFFRGFIREVLTIVGILGGTVASFYGGSWFSDQISVWLGTEDDGTTKKLFDIIPYSLLSDILAYGGIFVVVVIILSITSHFVAKGITAAGLGPVDRTLGVLFGLVRGILMLGILFMPVYLLIESETRKEWFSESHTIIYVEKTSGWLTGFLPESVSKDLEKKAEETAEETKKGARKTLENMELLKKGAETLSGEKIAPKKPEAKDAPAYEKDERRSMDSLIRQEANE